MEEYNDVNRLCYDVQDRLNILLQGIVGMKRSQNMSIHEKTALEKTTSKQKCQCVTL